MAMEIRSVARTTQPHLATLAGTLAPLLAVANAGSFHLRYQNGAVLIEQDSFTGVNLTSVDSAVVAAPAHTDALQAKAEIDGWSKSQLAFANLVRKELNRLRQSPTTTFAAFTAQQVIDAIKAEVDLL